MVKEISKKNITQRNIILKEGDTVITNTTERSEIFANYFSTVANAIGRPDVKMIFCMPPLKNIPIIIALKQL